MALLRTVPMKGGGVLTIYTGGKYHYKPSPQYEQFVKKMKQPIAVDPEKSIEASILRRLSKLFTFISEMKPKGD